MDPQGTLTIRKENCKITIAVQNWKKRQQAGSMVNSKSNPKIFLHKNLILFIYCKRNHEAIDIQQNRSWSWLAAQFQSTRTKVHCGLSHVQRMLSSARPQDGARGRVNVHTNLQQERTEELVWEYLYSYLVGGWTNPFEKYARQNRFIFTK